MTASVVWLHDQKGVDVNWQPSLNVVVTLKFVSSSKGSLNLGSLFSKVRMDRADDKRQVDNEAGVASDETRSPRTHTSIDTYVHART